MIQGIYGWVEDIAFYSILLVLVQHMLPKGEQKKYVQFFMGLIFIVLILSPVFQWTGQTQEMTDFYLQVSYEQEKRAFLQEQERLERSMEVYTQEALEEALKQAEQEGPNGREEYGREDERGQLVEPVEIRPVEKTAP